jgi:2'-5' RNA ligase
MVRTYQRAIEHLPDLDLIPAQWLHITMQGIGFTDEIAAGEFHDVAHALARELSAIDPPAARFHYLTVHPEAVYLKAHPASALYPLRAGMHRAAAHVLGLDRVEPLPTPEEFNPHVSIAYVSADGEADPVAQALKTAAAEPVTATFAKASLLVFHRDTRMYEWTSANPIAIGSSEV